MKKDYTYIGCVLDRSGSMETDNLIAEARGGFNKFLKEQQELEGTADIMVTIFDNEIDVIYNDNIQECFKLTKENFYPRASTSLLDAIGLTISKIGAKLDAMQEEEKPDKVIILIITDGYENSSQEYTNKQIKEMVTKQEKEFNWEFIFLASNLSAVQDARNLYGFSDKNSKMYSKGIGGTTMAFADLNTMTSNYRNTGDTKFEDGDSKKDENDN